MELQLHLNRWEHREPDWAAAAVAGFAAGAALMVLELLWVAMMGSTGPWRISQLVAALVLGPDTLRAPADSFNLAVVAVALVTHYVLGVVFGVVLGFLITGFHYDTSPGVMAIVGAGFGAVLYLLNFHGIAQFFPWLAELRGWTTVVAHLIFGITASLLYRSLMRRRAPNHQRTL